MNAQETKVCDFQKSQPLPSFRLNAPNTNPFVPSLPTSVTGESPRLEFAWKTDGTGEAIVSAPDQARTLLNLTERLRREIKRFPTSTKARINLAIALSNQGDLAGAEDELLGTLELEKDNYLAKLNLAQLFARRGKYDEADTLYNEMLSDRPSDNTLLMSLAVLALRRRDFSGAEERLRQAVRNNEGDAAIHFLLGMVRLCMNNLRGAMGELRSASRIDVRNPAIHQALGVVFALRAEFNRAEQEFRAALMFVPNDTASIRALYQVLLNQEKTAEAVEVLNSFIERNPGDITAREALALALLDLKRFGSARFHLNKVLAEGAGALSIDQAARIQVNIGLSCFLEGKVEAARNAFIRAINTHPSVSPIAYENFARLLLSEENYEAAIDVLRRSQLVFPKSTVTATLLSHIYSLIGEEDRAIRELESFRSKYDPTASIFIHLGFLYSQLDRPQESMEVSKEGAKRFPDSVKIANNLAYAYAMMDQLEDARTALRVIPKDFIPHAELIATKGLLRLREGDEKAGVALYEEAERRAAELGDKELAKRVRQKKHLELARYWMRKKSFDRARLELKRGLAIKVKYFSYENNLKQLANDLNLSM